MHIFHIKGDLIFYILIENDFLLYRIFHLLCLC